MHLAGDSLKAVSIFKNPQRSPLPVLEDSRPNRALGYIQLISMYFDAFRCVSMLFENVYQ